MLLMRVSNPAECCDAVALLPREKFRSEASKVGRYDDRNRDYTFADVFLRRRLDEGFPYARRGVSLSDCASAIIYIPGGGKSFWKLIGFLLLVIGFLIAL
jgi:hypothetical protein